MKLKRIKVVSLSLLLALGVSATFVSCSKKENTDTSIDETIWDNEEEKVFFERRLWSKNSGDQVGEQDNHWSYQSGTSTTLSINSNDGTVRFRKNGDSITTESFTTSKPFSVDITMSLNGGNTFPTGLVLNKGDLEVEIQALGKNDRVVSSVVLNEASQFAKENSMDVIRVRLNQGKKVVNKVRIVLNKAYYKNHIELNVGIGRVKVYQGKQETTYLADEIQDGWVSTVKGTNNEAHDYEDIPSQGIRLSDVRKSSYDFASRGNKKLLVIPVRFTDTKEENLNVYESGKRGQVAIKAEKLGGFDGIRHDIEAAYFGSSEETGWESLSSYYYKSSGGKLNITGKVSAWYTYPATVTEFYEEGNGASSVYNLAEKACQWYKENYDDFLEFDQDGDGYFDCVQFVYTQPNCNYNSLGVCSSKYPNASDLFWAFCWKRSGLTAVKNWPKIFTFAWFSYDFLYNNFNEEYVVKNAANEVVDYLPDTHTITHETGHALGLADYYSTGYDGSSPLSGIDMMDNNVGDHNSYSKWQFEWYGPKEQIIYDENDEKTKKYEVTIRPFESSGDFVIIPAYSREELMTGTKPGYLDSSYSEFLTLEYYTPTGLNEQDSKSPYSYASGVHCMTEAGLKVLHVDSRLAYLAYNNSTAELSFSSYLPVNADKTQINFGSTTQYIELAHRNDATEQNYDTVNDANKDFRLISSVFANGKESTKSNRVQLSNEHLWGSATSQVMDFGVTNHQDFTFNNNYVNRFNFEITSMTAESMTIVFTYNNK